MNDLFVIDVLITDLEGKRAFCLKEFENLVEHIRALPSENINSLPAKDMKYYIKSEMKRFNAEVHVEYDGDYFSLISLEFKKESDYVHFKLMWG